MGECRICGGDLVKVGRLRLCRSCSSAFVAIAAPPETWDASRADIVQQTVEAWDRLNTTLAATQGREAALIKRLHATEEAFLDYGRALRIVLDMAEKRAHKRISAYVRDVIGNGHEQARLSEHLTKWERSTEAAARTTADERGAVVEG